MLVDYEYWFYGYQTLLHIKPDIISWRKELEEKYDIMDLMVFADFSPKNINMELQKIRNVTNTIIETQNTDFNRKKDMTDFIILDYLYQSAAERQGIDTYILFSGDGHFHSVVKYLIQKKHTEVVVYGVKESISNQLQSVATSVVEMPATSDVIAGCYRLIIENMNYVSQRPNIIPTFNGTVEAIAAKHKLSQEHLRVAMREMMDQGYLYQKLYRVAFNKQVKIIAANWELLIKDGLWKVE